MGLRKIANSNVTRKQIIMTTLQETRKELNHYSLSEEKKTKKRKEKIKSTIKEYRDGELEEHNNTINNNGETTSEIIRNILQEKIKKLKNKDVAKKINKGKGKKKVKENTDKKSHVDKKEIIDNKKIQSVQLPEISSYNWDKFKKEIAEEQAYKYNREVKKCLDKMHGYRMFNLHFTSLHFIRKAIVESLLTRKWDNLIKLLAMLIKNYSDPIFTIFIRHMCEILKHYHPRIRGTELEDQIELIMEKYENIRNSRQNISTSTPLN